MFYARCKSERDDIMISSIFKSNVKTNKLCHCIIKATYSGMYVSGPKYLRFIMQWHTLLVFTLN